MKRSTLKPMTLAALVAGGWLLPSLADAGEALVFSGAQSRPDPQLLLKKSKEKELEGGKLAPANPALLVTPNQLPVPRDKTLDRRTRNALIEEKNWIDFDKGELDARDEERNTLGILETGATAGPGEEPRAARTGQPRLNSKLSSLPASRLEAKNSPGQARRNGGDPKNPEAVAEDPTTAIPKPGSAPGINGVADMNLRSLLAPGKANSLAPMDRSTVTWHDIFGGTPSGRSPAAEAGPREDSVAADGFRGVAPGGPLSPAAPGGDALRFRSDFATRPAGLGGSPLAAEPALTPPPTARSFTSLAPPSAPKAPVADFSRPQGFSSGGLGRQDSLNPLAPPTPAYPAYQTPAAQPASGSAFNSLPSRPR